jgi:AcrR family transcriptional regulator
LTPIDIGVVLTDMKKGKRRYAIAARAAKAQATRARIKASAIALYCEGPIEDFTLDEVARRAGVAVRTVLRAFPGKEALLYDALEELAKSGVPLKASRPGDVPAAVAAIFDVYETMGDLVMQRLNDERRHPGLKPLLDQGRENHRSWVKTTFAPCLASERGNERAQLLEALVVATDVYVWKLLRRDRGLSRPAAEAVMRRMIVGLAQKREQSDGTDTLAELVRRRQPAA